MDTTDSPGQSDSVIVVDDSEPGTLQSLPEGKDKIEKRKAQNRAAQKALRERRLGEIRSLQDKVKRLKAVIMEKDTIIQSRGVATQSQSHSGPPAPMAQVFSTLLAARILVPVSTKTIMEWLGQHVDETMKRWHLLFDAIESSRSAFVDMYHLNLRTLSKDQTTAFLIFLHDFCSVHPAFIALLNAASMVVQAGRYHQAVMLAGTPLYPIIDSEGHSDGDVTTNSNRNTPRKEVNTLDNRMSLSALCRSSEGIEGNNTRIETAYSIMASFKAGVRLYRRLHPNIGYCVTSTDYPMTDDFVIEQLVLAQGDNALSDGTKDRLEAALGYYRRQMDGSLMDTPVRLRASYCVALTLTKLGDDAGNAFRAVVSQGQFPTPQELKADLVAADQATRISKEYGADFVLMQMTPSQLATRSFKYLVAQYGSLLASNSVG